MFLRKRIFCFDNKDLLILASTISNDKYKKYKSNV